MDNAQADGRAEGESTRTLAIIPCGKAKVWDKNPGAGPTLASSAYTGVPFRMNREYAQTFGDSWMILSAKYGFRRPRFIIPGPYNVTFNRAATAPIASAVLRRQVSATHLERFDRVICLGGKHYRARVEEAFAGTGVELAFPFAGLGLGMSLRAVKQAIATGREFG